MATDQKLILTEPGKTALIPVNLPAAGSQQIIVRTVVSGISHGTEMTAFLGTSPFIAQTFREHRTFGERQASDAPFYPFQYLGYDNVGIVEMIGSDVRSVAVGDRVWSGSHHQTRVVLTEGASEFYKLPAAVPNEAAIITNLVAVALTAIHDAQIKLGDVVAVFGGGAVGQIVTQLAMLSGASRVFLIDPLESRRALAGKTCGADTLSLDEAPAISLRKANDSAGPDAIIECSGSVKGLRSAVQLANVGGTVIAARFYAGSTGDFSFAQEFLHNRVTLKASMGVWGCPMRAPFWDRPRMLKQAGAMLAPGKLDITGWPSATVPFEQAQRAYEMIRDQPKSHLKVMLSYPAP